MGAVYAGLIVSREYCMMTPKQVFIREATGLVREWSTIDAFYYNILTCGIFTYASVWLFLTTPYAFPGGSIPLAVLVTGVFNSLMAVAFVMLAVSMPRTGGEYVFQSRVIHPAIGFSVVFAAWVVWQMNWLAWNFYAVVWLVAYPLTSTLGAVTGNTAFLDFAAWSGTVTGTTIVGGLYVTIVFMTMVTGMKGYARVQRVAFWLAILSIGISIVVGAMTPTRSFEAAFNEFMLKFQTDPNFYSTIISTAVSAGYNVHPEFSLFSTLGIVPILYMTFVWFYWSTYNLGEIKKADSVKNQVISLIGAELILMLLFVFLSASFISMIGTDFMYALAYHWNEGTDIIAVFPTDPSFTLLTGMVAKSAPLLAVLYIGVLGNFWNYPYNNTMGATRPMLAMAFDRLLPEKLADVSERFHIPHVAIAVNYVLVWIWYYIITFTPFSAWLTSMMASACLSIACTLLSAILLPYRRKDLFGSSPAYKYRLIGIPIITICGIIGFIWNLIMLYFYLVVPAYGGANPIPLAVNLLILAGCFVYYFAIHSYRKKQGIEIDLAFKQIPPE